MMLFLPTEMLFSQCRGGAGGRVGQCASGGWGWGLGVGAVAVGVRGC